MDKKLILGKTDHTLLKQTSTWEQIKKICEEGMEFDVEGNEDAQVTVELEAEAEYKITIDGEEAGVMKTNLGGKLTVGVELAAAKVVKVSIQKL